MKPVQDDLDDELLPLFLEEADELCPIIGSTLLAWRTLPANALLERKLQRTLHTLKGSARMAGAMRVGSLVHRMEDQVTASLASARQPDVYWDELQQQFDQIGEMINHLRTRVAEDICEARGDESTQQRVPFATIGKRLYRIVRQTGKELGKKANLELHGTDIELQRSMLEKLTAPFEHLLRNAIAHGLESPHQRELAGKPLVGDIRLSLLHKKSEAVFEFADDGAGLDIHKLRHKAIEMGLLPAEPSSSDDQVMQLIFAPGLTTATEVTAISGRGVGMDVVRSEIVALGGHITVSSERGTGTCFTIRLPNGQD